MVNSYKIILTNNQKWIDTVYATSAKEAFRKACKLYPTLKGWYIEKYNVG